MKISINSLKHRSLLPEGRHEVKIVDVIEGVGETGAPYFQCIYENYKGDCIKERYYNTEDDLPVIVKLFKSCGFEVTDNIILDTNILLNKELQIFVTENVFANHFTDEYKSVKMIVDYRGKNESDLEA